MLPVKEVAKWFISKNPILTSGYMDENIKVNKLIYLSNLMYFCIKNENLVDEDFIAFPNGPVVYSVYRDYRYNGLNSYVSDISINDETACKVLNIVNFIFGNASTNCLVDETHSHSIWYDVKHLIPNNPKINFDKADEDLLERYRLYYQVYSELNFDNLATEKINDNIFYYFNDTFAMNDEVIDKLSTFDKFEDPKFLELIEGELVVS